MFKPNGSTKTTITIVILALISLPVILASPFSRSSTTNAHQRLHRRAPLHSFKYYDGDYDIRSKHYWASIAFTGIHGYALAGVWMISGLGFGLLLIINKSAASNTSESISQHSDSSYYLMLVLIAVFTLFAITATGFILVTNQQVLHESQRMERTVLGAGSDAHREIDRVDKAMKDIQLYLCPYDSKTCALLSTTTYQLGNESLAIKQFVQKNGHLIGTAISRVHSKPCAGVGELGFFLVAALVLILLHWHLGLVFVIFFCWILTTACWVITGVDFSLHNFAEDTCAALDSFLENSRNSSLSSSLPCEDLIKSEHIMMEIGQTVHNFITEMNSKIIELPKDLRLYEPSIYDSLAPPKICDPFSGPPNYTFVQGRCPKNTITIGQLPDILERFTCNNNGSSSLPRCLPDHTIAYAFIHSIEDLIGVYPDIDGLIHCSTVKNKLSDTYLRHCRPFKRSTRHLWIWMLCQSTTMVVLILLWITKACQDRRRTFSLSTVTPKHTQP